MSLETRERRPADHRAPLQDHHHDTPSLTRPAPRAADIPLPYEISERGREIIAAYLEPEIAYAFERGWQACEAHYAGLHAVAADVARRTALRGPFADLAERRGQHARAARQREILADRGVVA